MKKKRVLKKKYRKLLNKIKATTLLILIIVVLFYILNIILNKKYIENVIFNNNIVISLKKDKEIYCLISNKEVSVNDEKWVLSNNKKCILPYTNKGNIYLKYKNKIIYNSNKDLYIDTSNDKTIYLALNDTYKLYNSLLGNENKLKISNSNDKVITVLENGNVKVLNTGNSIITLKANDKTYTYNIIVTDLITKRPVEYDLDKKYLSCNKYTKEENDTLDLILKTKIENVGYKTRAAAVEAARFLTLDFPYRIDYFYENGRQTTNNVDGEGRYYHIGLYLHESRFDSITGFSKGPKTWGCSLYSTPAKRNMSNGLDCSGFVSWALLNAGFDVKDVGAGWSDKEDLTDFGKVERVTTSLSSSDTIRVGDLLHSERAGGHIGIIVGIDETYYYIAQALWFNETGVIITKIQKNKLSSEFPHVVLMDDYYKEDGKLTNMW